MSDALSPATPSSSAAATTASSAPRISPAAGLDGLRRSSAARVVGGAAVTEEFHPGLPQLDRELHGQPAQSEGDPRPAARAARPARRRAAVRELPAAARRRRYLKVGGGSRRRRRGRAVLARATPSACPRTTRCSSASPTCCASCCARTPPNVGGPRRAAPTGSTSYDVAKRLKRARHARRGATCSTSSPRARARCSTAGSSRAPIKAAFGFDAVVGNFASPYTPGSAYVLLHHVFGEVNGKRGQWGHAIGGMGAITQAMARGVRGARRRDPHGRRRSRA